MSVRIQLNVAIGIPYKSTSNIGYVKKRTLFLLIDAFDKKGKRQLFDENAHRIAFEFKSVRGPNMPVDVMLCTPFAEFEDEADAMAFKLVWEGGE